MSEQVRKVGSRAGRFVEAYEIPKTMSENVLISYRLWDWGCLCTF